MLLTVGLNHNTAPVSVRETIALPEGEFEQILQDFIALPNISEGAILSTCNRTELYAVARTDKQGQQLQNWLCQRRGLDSDKMAQHFYVYKNSDSIRHILRVASGLDSMILGEPQILGQMKQAYRQARKVDGTGPLLSRLFEHSFSVAKQIRTQTDIGVHPVSVAYAGAHLASHIFSNLASTQALFVGAGETIELSARYFSQIGVNKMIFANRSIDKAQNLAELHQGQAIGLTDISNYLDQADLVISSTSAPHAIIGLKDLKKAIKARRRKPMFILDMAVPRDVDPAATKLDDIYLYSVDDLENVIQENQHSRQKAAQQADAMLDTRINEYLSWLESRQANNTIKTMRMQAHAIKDQAIAHAMHELKRGDDPEAVLERFGRSLTNKLIHAPSATLHQAQGARQTILLSSAQQLFRLQAPSQSDE